MADDDEIGYEDEFNDFVDDNNYNSNNINSNNSNNNINNNNNNDNNFLINNPDNTNNNTNQNNIVENKNNTNSFNLFTNKSEISPQSQPSSEYIEKEEKTILMELANLEKEKEKWYAERKVQNEILQKNIELLKSLSAINQLDFPYKYKNDTKIELNNLILYNTKLSEIESEERILEQDKNFFEEYKSNFNIIYDEKQKEIEKLKLDYEQEKNELDKKLELLEIEEKMINDKYNNFEKEKNIITQRYNEALKKESLLNNAKIRIENNLRELDRRNLNYEINNQMINEKRKEIENEILRNNNEQKNLQEEKNNLNLRQEMIDNIRMKYIGDITNNPFTNTYNKNNEKSNYLGINTNNYNNNNNNDFISSIRQNTFNNYGKNSFNFGENDILKKKYNFENKNYNSLKENNLFNNNNLEPPKLSIINEEDNNIKNSSNNNL